jgi:dihydropteroate synthase
MAVRIISISSKQGLAEVFRDLKVDPYGIAIMLPKAIPFLIHIDRISCIAANILKQEMLSLGADAALPRDVLTGKLKSTPCVLIASLSQITKLVRKLRLQPLGLAKLGEEILSIVNNYGRTDFTLSLCQHRLHLANGARIMGIVNLTPDSFSGDGLYNQKADTAFLVEYVRMLIRDGADIIDIGGESSRPGAKAVSVKDELNRTIPAIRVIRKKLNIPVSIDTRKPEVASAALDNGACLVNDISGLRNNVMAKTISRYKAGVVIMHMQNGPANMQKNPQYKCVTDDVITYLGNKVSAALEAGIASDKIIVDPGIGFGKTLSHNLELLRNLHEFRVLGMPILVGTSRKSFIGALTNTTSDGRLAGSIASCVLAVNNGAHIVRVHDVKQIKQALTVTEAILHD